MDKITLPCFIDCEASSLRHDSYPIEIGWSEESGMVKSFIIDPSFVPNWIDWDEYAEREIHHISQTMLSLYGISPQFAAQQLNNRLKGKIVFSDAPDYDSFWLRRLFQATEIEPLFKVGDFFQLLHQVAIDAYRPSGISSEKIEDVWERAQAQADKQCPHTHRARNDVKNLQLAYQYFCEEL